MSLLPSEAYQRIERAARVIDPALAVDRGAVHWRDEPLPGVSYGLSLGGAHALLFLPAADIIEPGWEDRLPQRLEAAHRYLTGFPARARSGSSPR
jgi:hypothetical protein